MGAVAAFVSWARGLQDHHLADQSPSPSHADLAPWLNGQALAVHSAKRHVLTGSIGASGPTEAAKVGLWSVAQVRRGLGCVAYAFSS